MNPLPWLVRSAANALGVAWWARVESHSPECVYWFGPFTRRGSLEAQLHQLLRTRRGEPLTEPG
jgi:hypothetical protein